MKITKEEINLIANGITRMMALCTNKAVQITKGTTCTGINVTLQTDGQDYSTVIVTEESVIVRTNRVEGKEWPRYEQDTEEYFHSSVGFTADIILSYHLNNLPMLWRDHNLNFKW